MKKIGNIIWNYSEEIILATLVFVMGGVLFLQVFFRYVLNNPLTWSEELARYLFVYITIIGFSYNVKKNNLTKVELFLCHLPRNAQKIINLIMTVIPLVLFFLILPSSVDFFIKQKSVISSSLSIPMSVFYIVVPLGIILTIVSLVVRIKQIFLSFFSSYNLPDPDVGTTSCEHDTGVYCCIEKDEDIV